MAKRRAKLVEETTNKATLADAPEATRKLTDIKPHEVSIVDFPANGEPFFVMKSLNGKKEEKLSREEVPIEKMKILEEQLTSIKKNLDLAKDSLTKFEVKKSVDKEPTILKALLRNVFIVLKNIRGESEDSIDTEEITKQYEQIEKGNAVSFLTRDRYAYVTQSICEYVTTYLDGIEHDDDGPMLIPLGLDSAVDKYIDDIEDVIEDDEEEMEKNEEVKTEKEDLSESEEDDRIEILEKEISSLKRKLENATVSDREVNKKGSKISKDRLKMLKSISNDIGNAHEQMSNLLQDLESNEVEERKMADEKETIKNADPIDEDKVEEEIEKSNQEEQPEEDKLDRIAKAFDALCGKLDEKFESLEKSTEEKFKKLEETQKENTNKIEKFASLRVDSRADEQNDEIVVEKSVDDLKKEKASFKNILGIV